MQATVAKPMKRPLYIATRCFGVLLGLLALVAIPVALSNEAPPGIDVIAFCIVAWMLGVIFLRYGIKGRGDAMAFSPRQNLLVRLPLGLLYVTVGLFLLIEKHERSLGVFTGAILVVLGASSLRAVYESRRVGRAA